MSTLCVVPALLSALAFYLATPHQRLWPSLARRRRLLRLLACMLALLALAAGIAALGTWPGTCSALSALMLGAVALPYLDTWRRLRLERRDVG